MTEVKKIKQALDPELYVKAVARWQKEDEAARLAAKKVVSFTPAQPRRKKPQAPQKPRKKQTQKEPDRADPNLVFSVLLAAFGMFCLAVSLIV